MSAVSCNGAMTGKARTLYLPLHSCLTTSICWPARIYPGFLRGREALAVTETTKTSEARLLHQSLRLQLPLAWLFQVVQVQSGRMQSESCILLSPPKLFLEPLVLTLCLQIRYSLVYRLQPRLLHATILGVAMDFASVRCYLPLRINGALCLSARV